MPVAIPPLARLSSTLRAGWRRQSSRPSIPHGCQYRTLVRPCAGIITPAGVVGTSRLQSDRDSTPRCSSLSRYPVDCLQWSQKLLKPRSTGFTLATVRESLLNQDRLAWPCCFCSQRGASLGYPLLEMPKSWTDKHEYSLLKGELATSSDRAFERAALPFQIIFPELVSPPARRAFDRAGANYFV